MTLATIKRHLKAGATIQKGSFSGYWLAMPGGKRVRLSGLQAATALTWCHQIDDRSSRVGAEFAIKPPATKGES